MNSNEASDATTTTSQGIAGEQDGVDVIMNEESWLLALPDALLVEIAGECVLSGCCTAHVVAIRSLFIVSLR